MDVRPLHESERDAFLDLLGLWELPDVDVLPARDFFARYVDGDPGFRARDVWVADEGGRPVCCVQVFPRTLLVDGKGVPTGGIGSVFTHPDARGRGLAAAVMRMAMADMAERGLALGLLFAGPVPFYEKLGWQVCPLRRPLLRRPGAAGLEAGEPFEPARDLDDVQAIHARYSAGRDATCTRSETDWRTSLRNAGNPHEEFRVLRRDGEVVAYLRAAAIARILVLSEWGYAEGAADALAALVAAALTPRAPDPLAPPGRGSAELRAFATGAPLLDRALEQALDRRGIGVEHADDRQTLVWTGRPGDLARCLGLRLRPGELPADLLARALPAGRFAFWPADRF